MSQFLLRGVTVIELAGLAPGPLCGQMLADYGARVIRIDRTSVSVNPDQLTRGKQSVALDLRNPKGQEALRTMLESDKVDVLIDTYRPGVLERLNILPQQRLNGKEPLVVARLTGYGQTGELSNFAGHDINYLAASGVLGIVGPPNKPQAVPANILGDFAALSLPGFAAIVTALFSGLKNKNTKANNSPYTLVDVNIVDSLKYLAQFATYSKFGPYDPKNPQGSDEPIISIVPWNQPRGLNVLEGHSCPYYTVYATKDANENVTVGALEPQFYQQFLEMVVGKDEAAKLPSRDSPANWPILKDIFAKKFKEHGIEYWKKQALKYPDSCVMPISPLAHSSEIPNQIVQFDTQKKDIPGGQLLTPGKDTNAVLEEFLGGSWKSKYGSEFSKQAKLEKI
ncbi:uncharacterized protein SAPINGB_P003159 [Magnusiomyces paraingens]|uniref:Uncharacterized protein n=1 Tax=Magnusiomyces paraingens TaxID=2606893 RepID=A0A5E8BM99_9ASCO|nr:uncharacterized protein SAPINGB_P003159 [Saprochaete ingens]VVT51627.1 unnamed protein product [Saprochaete ingens]